MGIERFKEPYFSAAQAWHPVSAQSLQFKVSVSSALEVKGAWVRHTQGERQEAKLLPKIDIKFF